MTIRLLSSAMIAIVCHLFAVSQLAAAEKELTIIVDAGHGGHDVGAVSNDLKESDVALTMAKELAGKLRQLGHNVVLTRDGDKFMSLRDRAALAKKIESALFISLHTGSSKDANVRGMEVFHRKLNDGQKPIELAKLLAKNLGGIQPNRKVQVREARINGFGLDNWLLLEMGMLTNMDDAKLLSNEKDRDSTLQVVSKTINDYLSK